MEVGEKLKAREVTYRYGVKCQVVTNHDLPMPFILSNEIKSIFGSY
jgi:hypothetical protein